jgi:hypothetical protein
MGNSESRPSPGEDVQRGRHGGDRDDLRRAEAPPGRSSQAAGKDPGRSSTRDGRRPDEPRSLAAGRDAPPAYDTDPGAGPPGSKKHARGWRADDAGADADSALPGRESGAGGGRIDGPQR